MMKFKVKMLAFKGADKGVFTKGINKFLHLIDENKVEFVTEHPDVLFFLSGGSEAGAISTIRERKFFVLIASKENNSYASATEVKAYLNQRGIKSVLLDFDDESCMRFIENYYNVKRALASLRGQSLGLIGEASDWLVASSMEHGLLREKLGINIRQILWSSLPYYKTFPADQEIFDTFNNEEGYDLVETSKVYSLLTERIKKERLDAVTVECFPLVKEHHVTACLPLAKLNSDGFAAGCEGDITSIVGMMLAKELVGEVPWMANTVRINKESSIFAHCTIAPDLLDSHQITTHFETNEGTAVQGHYSADNITIFRLNNSLSKAFLTTAKVLKRPKHKFACRTQIEVQMPHEAVKSLQNDPLGNHHLILPGDYTQVLKLVFDILNMDILPE